MGAKSPNIFKMDITAFIFLNIVIFGSFIYAKKDQDFSALAYGLGGTFSLYTILSLIFGGITSCCCDSSRMEVFPSIVMGSFVIMYAALALGYFVLCAQAASETGFSKK